LLYRFQINLGDLFRCQWRMSRDLRRQVSCIPEEEPARSFDADFNLLKQAWWEDDWQATPLPVSPTTGKLIPIVTTAATAHAVTLAQMYARRWPAQENIIRDYLLALGLDTNHGYAKTAVINSEVAKRRSALEEQGMADHLVRREIKERKATIDAELQELWQRVYRIEARQDQDWGKQERDSRQQREVLRALEDLAGKEREMYE
jgi:hypothetical protein